MADRLQTQAEAVMVRLEGRFGTAATYTKHSAQVIDDDGNITSSDETIACTLVPGQATAEDIAFAGLQQLEQDMRVWKGRQSVLGNDLSEGDTVTIASTEYEVIAPVILDALGVTWRILTRRIT